MTHIPELDGLRGIAVLAVVLMHAGLGCTGGFVGVDIFFVLSGFLITSIILDGTDAGTFSLFGFAERRVRRIAPALIVTLAATLIAGAVFLLPEDYSRLGRATMAQVVFLANLFHWQTSGYFGVEAEMLPLLHTWSLAVEEQFYLILPGLLLLIARFKRNLVLPALWLVTIGSFAVGVATTYTYPDAAFYLLPSRAWELLVGSLLAAMARWGKSASPLIREAVSAIGLLFIAVSIFLFDEYFPFPGMHALLPCLGAGAFIWANRFPNSSNQRTVSGRLISWPPLRFTGDISYSLYLVHWPLIVFYRYWNSGDLSLLEKISLVCVSFLLATLSWAIVETPIRRRRIAANRRLLFVGSGLAMLILLGCGWGISANRGIPQRFPLPPEKVLPSDRDSFWQLELTSRDILTERLGPLGDPQGEEQNMPIQCLLWGDSHAMALAPVVDELLKERNLRGGLATHSATAPLLGFVIPGILPESPTFNEAVLEFLKSKRVPAVILAGNWAEYAETPAFPDSLRRTIDELVRAGIEVTIVLDVGYQPDDVPKLIAQATLRGEDLSTIGTTIEEHRRRNAKCEPLLRALSGPHVTILDPTDTFALPNGHWEVATEGTSQYRDRHHLTPKASLRLKPLLQPTIDRLQSKR
ncbi:MAG: acyltransferase [Planctomycetaceae bacterium]|nr:acyltransferase [Planctomycetaceae bacterium]